jgi:hypothetical protein
MPGKPEAIAAAGFLPRAFVKAMAERARDAHQDPAGRTVAYVQALGAKTFDDALDLGSGAMPRDLGELVNSEVTRQAEQAASTAERWARTAERLGRPGAKLEDIL